MSISRSRRNNGCLPENWHLEDHVHISQFGWDSCFSSSVSLHLKHHWKIRLVTVVKYFTFGFSFLFYRFVSQKSFCFSRCLSLSLVVTGGKRAFERRSVDVGYLRSSLGCFGKAPWDGGKFSKETQQHGFWKGGKGGCHDWVHICICIYLYVCIYTCIYI